MVRRKKTERAGFVEYSGIVMFADGTERRGYWAKRKDTSPDGWPYKPMKVYGGWCLIQLEK